MGCYAKVQPLEGEALETAIDALADFCIEGMKPAKRKNDKHKNKCVVIKGKLLMPMSGGYNNTHGTTDVNAQRLNTIMIDHGEILSHCLRHLPGFSTIVEAAIAEARRVTGNDSLELYDTHIMQQAAALITATVWSKHRDVHDGEKKANEWVKQMNAQFQKYSDDHHEWQCLKNSHMHTTICILLRADGPGSAMRLTGFEAIPYGGRKGAMVIFPSHAEHMGEPTPADAGQVLKLSCFGTRLVKLRKLLKVNIGAAYTSQSWQKYRLGKVWQLSSQAMQRKLYEHDCLKVLSTTGDRLFKRLLGREALKARRRAMERMGTPHNCGSFCNSMSIIFYPEGTEGVWHVDRNFLDAVVLALDVGARPSSSQLQIGATRYGNGHAVVGDFSVPHRATKNTVNGAMRAAVVYYIKRAVARKAGLVSGTALRPETPQARPASETRQRRQRRVAVYLDDVRGRNPRFYEGTVVDSSRATGDAVIRFDDREQKTLNLRAQLDAGLAEWR